jgi:hypothetical protein
VAKNAAVEAEIVVFEEAVKCLSGSPLLRALTTHFHNFPSVTAPRGDDGRAEETSAIYKDTASGNLV